MTKFHIPRRSLRTLGFGFWDLGFNSVYFDRLYGSFFAPMASASSPPSTGGP